MNVNHPNRGQIYVNDDEVEERTVRLHDGPLNGQFTPRPRARLRKKQHAQAFRLPDEQQPWQPGMPESECVVEFAIYLWIVSDQRYGYVDNIQVRSQEELDRALAIVQEG